MAQILIRRIDDAAMERLRAVAKQRGMSVEAVAREAVQNLTPVPSRDPVIEARSIRAMNTHEPLDSVAIIREYRDNDSPYR